MITKNAVIFGLGTVGAGVYLDQLDLFELRLGRYKVGEPVFREDTDKELKARINFENSHEKVMCLMHELGILKYYSQKHKKLSIHSTNGDTLAFDFTRGESDKAIDVVIGWLDAVAANILFLMYT